MRPRHALAALAPAALLVLLAASPARADLDEFLARPEPAYRWEKKGERKLEGCTVYELFLVSQEWHGKNWEHRLFLLRPDNVEHPECCCIYNAGGRGGDGDLALGAEIAKRSGTPIAMLFGVPNQPLWDKSEDALVVHTWLEFIASMKKDGKGDESWPLHFPMAKAVIKGMDAIQAFALSEKLPPVESFVVCGASKRGWTTWLVGASGDPRVKAIAPMVIDTLHVAKQADHMLESWGKPSEQIKDYTAAGMKQLIETPEGKRLLELVDPWSYRARLKLPKLIVNGTNDRYWTQDALNIYWDDLEGPKWVIYVPNSGHELRDRGRVVATLAAFVRAIATRSRLPSLRWTYTPRQDGGVTLEVTSDEPIEEARIFEAASPSKDFRGSRWGFEPMPRQAAGNAFKAEIPRPDDGNLAVFAEAVFGKEGGRFTISTQIRILGATPKKRWF